MIRTRILHKPLRSQLKLWGKLNQAKYRSQEGLFLAEGYKVVQELLSSTWKTSAILISGLGKSS